MQTLNYAPDVIEDLGRLADFLEYRDPLIWRRVQFLIRHIEAAPKFMLPAGGLCFEGMDSVNRNERALARAPYPVFCIEFEGDVEPDDGQSPVAVYPTVKRFALVMDLDDKSVREDVAAHLDPDHRALWPGRALLVMPIDFLQDGSTTELPPDLRDTRWFPCWVAAQFTLDEVPLVEDPREALSTEEYRAWRRGGGKGREVEKYGMHALVFNEAGTPPALQQARTQQEAMDIWQRAYHIDTSYECVAAAQLCIALACENLQAGVINAPPKLNAKRAKRGKSPLPDYRVVMLDPASSAGRPGTPDNRGAAGGDRRVRSHLRRGHLRRLASGKVTWVRATSVNTGMPAVGQRYAVPGPIRDA
ncbi:MAG: hypothetical protein RJQ08_04860 [Salinisphaeraceae bacterium]